MHRIEQTAAVSCSTLIDTRQLCPPFQPHPESLLDKGRRQLPGPAYLCVACCGFQGSKLAPHVFTATLTLILYHGLRFVPRLNNLKLSLKLEQTHWPPKTSKRRKRGGLRVSLRLPLHAVAKHLHLAHPLHSPRTLYARALQHSSCGA